MKETGLTGKRRSTTIAATPDDGNSQRKRRRGNIVDINYHPNIAKINVQGYTEQSGQPGICT